MNQAPLSRLYSLGVPCSLSGHDILKDIKKVLCACEYIPTVPSSRDAYDSMATFFQARELVVLRMYEGELAAFRDIIQALEKTAWSKVFQPCMAVYGSLKPSAIHAKRAAAVIDTYLKTVSP